MKIYGARVRVDSMAKAAEIEGAEKQKMREKVQKIIGHGINCFVNRQLIYNFPEELFADAGILAIEHADFDGIERLALVTGGEIASTFDNPESVKLGHCKLIEEIMIGEDKLIHFSGVEMGQACTIVLRGARYIFSTYIFCSFHACIFPSMIYIMCVHTEPMSVDNFAFCFTCFVSRFFYCMHVYFIMYCGIINLLLSTIYVLLK